MRVPVRCGWQIRRSMSATSPQPESPGAAEIDFFGCRGSGHSVGIGRACVRGGEWRLAGYGGLPGGSKSAPVGSWSRNSVLPPKKDSRVETAGRRRRHAGRYGSIGDEGGLETRSFFLKKRGESRPPLLDSGMPETWLPLHIFRLANHVFRLADVNSKF